MPNCKVCGEPFTKKSNSQIYCKECGDYYHKESRNSKKEKIGNPKQDKEILKFIRKNRQ